MPITQADVEIITKEMDQRIEALKAEILQGAPSPMPSAELAQHLAEVSHHGPGLCDAAECSPCRTARAGVARAAQDNFAAVLRDAAAEFGLGEEHDRLAAAVERYKNGERTPVVVITS